MNDPTDFDFAELPHLVLAVLGQMPAALADGWRQRLADAPLSTSVRRDDDGYLAVFIGGDQAMRLHEDLFRIGLESGTAEIMVDGRVQLVDVQREPER